MWDIEPGQRKIFRVPYAQEEYYSRNFITPKAPAIVPAGAWNGNIFVRVVNPLQTQNAGTTVRVLLWYRCAENMDFRMPRSVIINYFNVDSTNPVVPFDFVGTYQGLGDESPEEEEFISFGDSGATAIDAITYPGLGVRSVRALMQKPSRLYWSASGLVKLASLTSLGTFPPLNVPPSSVYSGDAIPAFNWGGFYRMMYTGIAAATRFTVFANPGTLVGATAMDYAGAVMPALPYGQTLMPMQRVGDPGATEIEVPWTLPVKFLNGQSTLPGNSRQNVCVYASAGGSDTAVTNLTIFESLASVRLVQFGQTPQLKWEHTISAPTGRAGFFQ